MYPAVCKIQRESGKKYEYVNIKWIMERMLAVILCAMVNADYLGKHQRANAYEAFLKSNQICLLKHCF